MTNQTGAPLARNKPAAFFGGAAIGTLGGLIGLGGAEFRLPLLIGPFGFAALEAVILNKAMSLVVVAFALPFRAGTVPFDQVAAHWPIILNLLAGSLAGAWLGAGWATRLTSAALYKVIAVMLLAIAGVLLLGHGLTGGSALVTGLTQVIAGVLAGLVIGVVASVLGVAGGGVAYPDAHPALRGRHQACRKPVTCSQPTHHDRRFYPLQPRPELHRHQAQPDIPIVHGCGVDPWRVDWRATPGDHTPNCVAAWPCIDPCPVGHKGLAAPLISRSRLSVMGRRADRSATGVDRRFGFACGLGRWR